MKVRLLKYVGILSLLFLSLLLVFIQSCDSDATDPQANEETINVAGSWELTTTITSNTFGLSNGETNTEFIYLFDNNGELPISMAIGEMVV